MSQSFDHSIGTGADRLKHVAAVVIRHRQVRQQPLAHAPVEPLDDLQLFGRLVQHRRDNVVGLVLCGRCAVTVVYMDLVGGRFSL